MPKMIYIAEDEKGETHAYSTENGEKLSDTDLKFGVVFIIGDS